MKATVNTKPFVNLPTTEEFFLFPDDNPNTVPIDPTNQQHLRSMSPFILALDPPDIGNYIPEGTNLPFRDERVPMPQYAFGRDIEELKISPKISTNAPPPISRTKYDGEVPFEEGGFTDRDQLISMALQHKLLSNLPPIVFMINPQSMAFSYSSIQNYSDTSRYGFVFYRWGEELTTIDISCKIGSFIAGRKFLEAPDPFNNFNLTGISGLQYASKQDSAGWRNLMAILGAYRNSATLVDTLGRSRAYHDVGTQSIYYDGQRWQGRITSLSFTIGEDNQNGGIDFSMGFTVYRHYQEGFEKETQIFQMHPPSPNLEEIQNDPLASAIQGISGGNENVFTLDD